MKSIHTRQKNSKLNAKIETTDEYMSAKRRAYTSQGNEKCLRAIRKCIKHMSTLLREKRGPIKNYIGTTGVNQAIGNRSPET